MNDHLILALMLLIQGGLLVAGLRMLQLVTRETAETSALAKAALDGISRLLQQKH